MACRPRQHGARYAEVIVLPWWATVHRPAFTHFGLKRHKLLISTSGRWSVDNSDLTRYQQTNDKIRGDRSEQYKPTSPSF
jgi:hypothetical protein